jgi:hypothetical protein
MTPVLISDWKYNKRGAVNFPQIWCYSPIATGEAIRHLAYYYLFSELVVLGDGLPD